MDTCDSHENAVVVYESKTRVCPLCAALGQVDDLTAEKETLENEIGTLTDDLDEARKEAESLREVKES